MSTPTIRLASLSRTFRTPHGSITAVDDIDLTIGAGEVVALLGPNGAGKTTTIDMILGLTEPTAGTVEVMGRRPRAAVLAGRVSAVLQTGGLLADLRVEETVRLIASTFAEHAPVESVMGRAGITALAGRRVSTCSGGEQQRLRFALALLPDPDLLILDEPTSGMDVNARREFWSAMRLEASRGRTIIFATHYLEEAQDFADRIVLMAQGRIAADGPTAEIRAGAGGRTLTVDLPTASRADGLARLRRHPGVIWAEPSPGHPRRVSVRSNDSDAVALILLTELGATGLEISADTLDDVFVALTTTPLEGAVR